MNREELLQQINEWQEANEDQKIIDAIEALSPEERDYELTCLLARAYINVSDQEDPEMEEASLEKAVSLLESVREDGKDDAVWYYFLGFSLFYLGKEEALSYFRRAVELDPDDPDNSSFIQECEMILAPKTAMHDQQLPDAEGEELDGHDEIRTTDEIVAAEEQFFEKVWFDRHMMSRHRIESGVDTVDPRIWKDALKAAEKIIKKYGEENLGPYDDFEWGMLNGKLSALRWVLGEDWDMLDT